MQQTQLYGRQDIIHSRASEHMQAGRHPPPHGVRETARPAAHLQLQRHPSPLGATAAEVCSDNCPDNCPDNPPMRECVGCCPLLPAAPQVRLAHLHHSLRHRSRLPLDPSPVPRRQVAPAQRVELVGVPQEQRDAALAGHLGNGQPSLRQRKSFRWEQKEGGEGEER